MGEQQPTRLDDLAIKEVSGVDHPANLFDGWVVVKSAPKAEPKPKEDGDQRKQWRQVRDLVAALADALDLKPGADDLDDVADSVLAGEAIDVEAVLAAFPKAPTKPEPNKQDEENEQDEEAEGEPGWPNRKKPKPKKPTPDEALAVYRKSVLDSDRGVALVADNARVLRTENKRMTEAESYARAAAAATGNPGSVSAVIKSDAARLVAEEGWAPGDAEVEAARAVTARLQRQLRQRESGKASKNVDPEVASIASEIRLARIMKGLSREAAADLVGTSVTTFAEWENGDHLPTGINITRLANALDGGWALVDKITKARGDR